MYEYDKVVVISLFVIMIYFLYRIDYKLGRHENGEKVDVMDIENPILVPVAYAISWIIFREYPILIGMTLPFTFVGVSYLHSKIEDCIIYGRSDN